jgi:hypothetical protein
MVTRFYLEADATTAPSPTFVNPTITPAYDAAWGVTGGAARRWMTTNKMLTPLAATAAVTETSTTSGIDVLARQFISTALTAQTIDGTVKGQIRVHESIDTADMQAQVVIRVCNNAGTSILATLLAADASGLGASEFAITTGTNRKFPLASVSPATLTSYACAAGDRLLVEIGYQAFNTTATSRNSIFQLGSNEAADLPEDETDATQDNPWIEFSDTLTFAEPERRITQVAELVGGSDTSERRVTQIAVLAGGSDTSERRISQVALLVLGSIPGGDHWGWTDSSTDSWQFMEV